MNKQGNYNGGAFLMQTSTSKQSFLDLIAQPTSREANELWIARTAIRGNALPPKALLHDDTARLIKANAALLHDAQHLLLADGVQAGALVAARDVVRHVEVRAVQARLSVVPERRRHRRVPVEVEGWHPRSW